MDSHGRYLEEPIGHVSASFRVLFKPVASTHQLNSTEEVPRRWMGEGSYVIAHLGTNNMLDRDGTQRKSANTLIRNIIDTCMMAERVCPNLLMYINMYPY